MAFLSTMTASRGRRAIKDEMAFFVAVSASIAVLVGFLGGSFATTSMANARVGDVKRCHFAA